MNHRAYRIGIGYFTLFALALLWTGFLMFWLKTGITITGIGTYYEGKSFEGLFELAHPHLGSMGLMIMVLGHFFLFTPLRHRVRWGFIGMFVGAGMTLAAPFGILYDLPYGAVFKGLGVGVLVGGGSLFALRLLRQIQNHPKP